MAHVLALVAALGQPAGADLPVPGEVDIALRAADELESAGAFAAARAQVAAVIDTGAVPADLLPGLGLMICALWSRQGELDRAQRCYVDLGAGGTDPEAVALARYRAALVAARLGAQRQAIAQLDLLISDASRTDAAHRALAYLRAVHREQSGAAGEADFLLGVASRLRVAGVGPGSALRGEALVVAGRIRLEERGNAPSAIHILARAREVAAGTAWLDDAIYWSARAARLARRFGEALALYDQLIAAHEVSWIAGSYTQAFFDDALYETGLAHEAAGELPAAIVAYQRVLVDAPDSVLVDDAAFAAARLRAAAGDLAALHSFVDRHGDSRHLGEARALLGTR